jgi:hypothetical protein
VAPVVIQAAVLVQQVAHSQVEAPQKQVLSSDYASEEALVLELQTVVVLVKYHLSCLVVAADYLAN